MQALGAHKFGSYEDEVLEFVQLPLPDKLSADELLVKVSYADINPVDFQKLSGGKPSNFGNAVPNGPFVPGFGGSGIVQEVGSPNLQAHVGKQVCFLVDPSKQRGSYASHVVVDVRCTSFLPKQNVELRDAAAIPVAGLTAYEVSWLHHLLLT
jgi:NADPH:quinone reductase